MLTIINPNNPIINGRLQRVKSPFANIPYNENAPNIIVVTKNVEAIDDFAYIRKIEESVIPFNAEYPR